MSHPHVYRALKRAGHSSFQAHIIILDATRGDGYALRWIKAVRRFT